MAFYRLYFGNPPPPTPPASTPVLDDDSSVSAIIAADIISHETTNTHNLIAQFTSEAEQAFSNVLSSISFASFTTLSFSISSVGTNFEIEEQTVISWQIPPPESLPLHEIIEITANILLPTEAPPSEPEATSGVFGSQPVFLISIKNTSHYAAINQAISDSEIVLETPSDPTPVLDESLNGDVDASFISSIQQLEQFYTALNDEPLVFSNIGFSTSIASTSAVSFAPTIIGTNFYVEDDLCMAWRHENSADTEFDVSLSTSISDSQEYPFPYLAPIVGVELQIILVLDPSYTHLISTFASENETLPPFETIVIEDVPTELLYVETSEIFTYLVDDLEQPISCIENSVSITSTSAVSFSITVNGSLDSLDDQVSISYIEQVSSFETAITQSAFDTESFVVDGELLPPDVPIVDGYEIDSAIGLIESIDITWFDYQPEIEPIFGQVATTVSIASTSSTAFTIAIVGTSFEPELNQASFSEHSENAFNASQIIVELQNELLPIEEIASTVGLDADGYLIPVIKHVSTYIAQQAGVDAQELIPTSSLPLSLSTSIVSTSDFSITINGSNFDVQFEQTPSFIEPDLSADSALAATFIDNEAIPIEGTPNPPDVPIVDGYDSDVALGIVESIDISWFNYQVDVEPIYGQKAFSVAISSVATTGFSISVVGTAFSDSPLETELITDNLTAYWDTCALNSDRDLLATSTIELASSISANSTLTVTPLINGTNFDISFEQTPHFFAPDQRNDVVLITSSADNEAIPVEGTPNPPDVPIIDGYDTDIAVGIIESIDLTWFNYQPDTDPIYSNKVFSTSFASSATVSFSIAINSTNFDVSIEGAEFFIEPDIRRDVAIAAAISDVENSLPETVSYVIASSPALIVVIEDVTSYVTTFVTALDNEAIPVDGTPNPPDVPIVEGYDGSDIASGIIEAIDLSWRDFTEEIFLPVSSVPLSVSIVNTSATSFTLAKVGTNFHDLPLETELITEDLSGAWSVVAENNNQEILPFSNKPLSVNISSTSNVLFTIAINGTNFDSSIELIPAFIEPDLSRDAALIEAFIDNHAIPVEGEPPPPDVPIVEGYDGVDAVGIIEAIDLSWLDITSEVFLPNSNKPFSVSITSSSTVSFASAIVGSNFHDLPTFAEEITENKDGYWISSQLNIADEILPVSNKASAVSIASASNVSFTIAVNGTSFDSSYELVPALLTEAPVVVLPEDGFVPESIVPLPDGLDTEFPDTSLLKPYLGEDFAGIFEELPVSNKELALAVNAATTVVFTIAVIGTNFHDLPAELELLGPDFVSGHYIARENAEKDTNREPSIRALSVAIIATSTVSFAIANNGTNFADIPFVEEALTTDLYGNYVAIATSSDVDVYIIKPVAISATVSSISTVTFAISINGTAFDCPDEVAVTIPPENSALTAIHEAEQFLPVNGFAESILAAIRVDGTYVLLTRIDGTYVPVVNIEGTNVTTYARIDGTYVLACRIDGTYVPIINIDGIF